MKLSYLLAGLVCASALHAETMPKLREIPVKDINGKEVELSAMRVVSIEARSPWEKSREPFTGVPKK